MEVMLSWKIQAFKSWTSLRRMEVTLSWKILTRIRMLSAKIQGVEEVEGRTNSYAQESKGISNVKVRDLPLIY